jgi:hypothetical protein
MSVFLLVGLFVSVFSQDTLERDNDDEGEEEEREAFLFFVTFSLFSNLHAIFHQRESREVKVELQRQIER